MQIVPYEAHNIIKIKKTNSLLSTTSTNSISVIIGTILFSGFKYNHYFVEL